MAQQWFYAEGDQKKGPFTPNQLKELAAKGQITPTTRVWTEGLPEWKEARSIKGLFPGVESASTPRSSQPTAPSASISNSGGSPVSPAPQQPVPAQGQAQPHSPAPPAKASGTHWFWKVAWIVAALVGLMKLTNKGCTRTADKSVATKPSASAPAQPTEAGDTQPPMAAKDVMSIIDRCGDFQWAEKGEVELKEGRSIKWVGVHQRAGATLTVTVESVNHETASVTLIKSGADDDDTMELFGTCGAKVGRSFAGKACLDWVGRRFKEYASGKIPKGLQTVIDGYGARFVVYEGKAGMDYWNVKLVDKVPRLKKAFEETTDSASSAR